MFKRNKRHVFSLDKSLPVFKRNKTHVFSLDKSLKFACDFSLDF